MLLTLKLFGALLEPWKTKENPLTTFVLVPGAWHGGWAWHPVAERLRAAGHRAVTVTLPGMNDGDDQRDLRLSDAVDHVVRTVEGLASDDVRLVAHSWGGYPMTGAAYRLRERLAGVVYYNAFVPAPGTSSFDEFRPESAANARAAIEASADGTWAPTLEVVRRALLPEAPAAAQDLLFELLVPQPGRYSSDPLDVPSVTTYQIPTAYVLSDDDRGLGRPDAGADFAARLGVTPINVPGSHQSLLTHPSEVAAAILRG